MSILCNEKVSTCAPALLAPSAALSARMLLLPFSLGLPLKTKICLPMRTSAIILLLSTGLWAICDKNHPYISQSSPIKVK
jgi:hypothetical protein